MSNVKSTLPANVDGSEACCFALYSRPRRTPDGYWKYRRGGYNPEDGTYGRCTTRKEALKIIRGETIYRPQALTLSKEQYDIMHHTVHRAAGGHYCGGGKDMDALVKMGLMESHGIFLGNPYFGITAAGREALKKHSKEGGPQS